MEYRKIEFELNSKVSVPIGFRFRPKKMELLKHYLLPKVTSGYFQPAIINELDVYAYQPWDLPGLDEEENEGYYFTRRSKKYPNGKRPSRFVYVKGNDEARPQFQGFWKMSSKIDDIRDRHGKLLGKKNCLNYISGSLKTEWKMHEFVLDPSLIPPKTDGNRDVLDEVVLCRIYTSDPSKGSKGIVRPVPSTGEPLTQLAEAETSGRKPSLPLPLPPQLSANPVPLNLVRQVPLTGEPLTQLAEAQTSWTKLSMPLLLPPEASQNHIVDPDPPQGGETAKLFAPSEAQLPQSGQSTSYVSQPEQLHDLLWEQNGDVIFETDIGQINFY